MSNVASVELPDWKLEEIAARERALDAIRNAIPGRDSEDPDAVQDVLDSVEESK